MEGCNDFAFLMLHETGHVFALDHSNVEENGSFDSDFDPLNSMSVDCESPHDGLALSDSVNPESVMNLDRWEQARTLMALSADELGALQFLYPVCSDAGDLGTEN